LVIQEELSDMLDIIRNGPRFEHENQIVQKGGYRVLLPHFFSPFSLNSLFHIIMNERTPRQDQAKLIHLVKMGLQFQRTGDDYGKMISIMPWIRYLFPEKSSYNKLMQSNTYIYNYFESFINRHIETYDKSYVRNFIDLYIKEMKQAEECGDSNTTFRKDQFVMSLIDFSFPAFTAVGIQLSLLIQYLLLYPEVQKKIQKEIDDVVGSGRLPTLEDRKDMSYTEACVREGLRIETLVPSDIPHKALVDTEIGGFKVPKVGL